MIYYYDVSLSRTSLQYKIVRKRFEFPHRYTLGNFKKLLSQVYNWDIYVSSVFSSARSTGRTASEREREDAKPRYEERKREREGEKNRSARN